MIYLRLKPSEASALGLTVYPKTRHGNHKYGLNMSQLKKLEEIRSGILTPLGLAALKSENSSDERILIVGDIHEPFCLGGYREFCETIYDKYKCNKVILIGDVIDNHYASYHETSADGYGGADELDLAIQGIKKWYRSFPKADVTIGNHDLMVMRKAQTSNIPTRWIKDYKDVLETPGWNFVDEIIHNNVMYHHGIGSKAHIKAVKNMISTVGGHWHTFAYVQWFVGKRERIFGMQVGCGFDDKTYAADYGKWYPKSAISCGVVLDNGKLPIIEMMDL